MKFEYNTYLVLDMPPTIWERVKSVREQYGSQLATLPVEITVIGSSGIGTFCEGQDEAAVFEIIDNVAAKFAPIKTTFRKVTTFPNTGVFYYEPDISRPFADLQSEIISTGIKFNESPFPFTPHCTIVKFDNPPDELVNEILSLEVPKGDIVLDTLSIYSLKEYDCRLLHNVALRGKS